MKNIRRSYLMGLLLAAGMLIAGGFTAGQAAEQPGSSHSAGHGNMGMEDMAPAGRDVETIHTVSVDGYRLEYRLIDLRERLQKMQPAPQQFDKTHHLMVYITDPQGHPVENAKTGYLIEGPDGSTQKVMTMAMSGGYGGDVKFEAPGVYTVKCKAVTGDQKLFDSFTYRVE